MRIKIKLYSNGNTILIKIQPLLLTFKCIKNNYPKFNTIKYSSLYLFLIKKIKNNATRKIH